MHFNRRQEIVLWIFGLGVALVCFSRWIEERDEWVVGLIAPLVTVGGLLLFSLRTREPQESVSTVSGNKLLAIAVLLALGAIAFHKLDAIESAANSADWHAEQAEEAAQQASSDADDAKTAAEQAARYVLLK